MCYNSSLRNVVIITKAGPINFDRSEVYLTISGASICKVFYTIIGLRNIILYL